MGRTPNTRRWSQPRPKTEREKIPTFVGGTKTKGVYCRSDPKPEKVAEEKTQIPQAPLILHYYHVRVI